MAIFKTTYRRRFGLCVAVTFSMFVLCSHAQADDKPCRYVKQMTLPITFAGLQPTIEGSINGKPVAMAIDTGAQSTSLFRGIAQKLDLPLSHSNVLSYGVGGESVEYVAKVKEITIGPMRGSNYKLGVIWDSSDEISYDVLVGAPHLFQRDLELSLAEQTIKFFDPVGCDDSFLAYWDPNASVVDMFDVSNYDSRKFVTIELNGQPIRALIDTGASRSMVDLKAADRLGITPQSPNVVKGGGGYGIGKFQLAIWVAPFDTFMIGDETIKNVKIEIADIRGTAIKNVQEHETAEWLRSLPEMILGADFLRAHRLLFATSQHRLYLSYLGGNVFYTDRKQDIAWYRKAAELGNADAQFNLGRLYETGDGVPADDAQAFAWYQKAAEKGNVAAQVSVGTMFVLGKGVQKNETQAMIWYRKAASLGNAGAYFNLGLMYESGEGVPEDIAQASNWYKNAAEMGNDSAQMKLGSMYTLGKGLPKDEKQAVAWYRKAADNGNAEAQFHLGYIYEKGDGVPQDNAEAVAWYRKAAEQASPFAQSRLGSMYSLGKGLPKDEKLAMSWYQKAADGGSADAQFNLGYIYEKGSDVPQDYAQALAWYQKSAAQGNSWAQLCIGYIYMVGKGVPKDGKQALIWFLKAAELGNADAQYNLAYMYETGEGVPKDDAQSLAWYLKAAENNVVLAQARLGYIYASGDGAPKDARQAIIWYQKAADLGNTDAQYNLGSMYESGKDTPKDDAQARALYQKAAISYQKSAEQGDASAQVRLAFMYAKGKGLPKDELQAIAWYRKAADQKHGPAYWQFGHLLFMSGEFGESAQALRHAVEKMPQQWYAPIWLYLARSRTHDDSLAYKDLDASSAAIKDGKWPKPIMDFYLGRLDSDVLFEMARDKDSDVAKGRLCEANFYVAERNVIQGKQKEARPLLEAAVKDCPRNFVEYEGAIAELNRLKPE